MDLHLCRPWSWNYLKWFHRGSTEQQIPLSSMGLVYRGSEKHRTGCTWDMQHSGNFDSYWRMLAAVNLQECYTSRWCHPSLKCNCLNRCQNLDSWLFASVHVIYPAYSPSQVVGKLYCFLVRPVLWYKSIIKGKKKRCRS